MKTPKEVMLLYLRVLDADAEGADPVEVCRVLLPSVQSDHATHVAQLLAKAKDFQDWITKRYDWPEEEPWP